MSDKPLAHPLKWWQSVQAFWRQLWSRKVAAGTYLAMMVGFAVLAAPPEWITSTIVRIGFAVISLLCGIGAGYEWWFRKEDAPATPADIAAPRLRVFEIRRIPVSFFEGTYVVRAGGKRAHTGDALVLVLLNQGAGTLPDVCAHITFQSDGEALRVANGWWLSSGECPWRLSIPASEVRELLIVAIRPGIELTMDGVDMGMPPTCFAIDARELTMGERRMIYTHLHRDAYSVSIVITSDGVQVGPAVELDLRLGPDQSLKIRQPS